METARTILEQFGGRGFSLMTGAKNYTAIPNGLRFRLPGNPGYVRQGINLVTVTLNSLDLYDIEFGRAWGADYKIKKTCSNVYAENLTDIFRDVTGLETRMPRIVRA